MPHPAVPGLADPAFSLHVAPDAVVRHAAWRDARASALASLGDGRQVVLAGLPGAGKSLLLQDLARTLRGGGRPVQLLGQAEASGNPRDGGVLLVDDADALGADALAVLCAGAGPVLLAMRPGGATRLPPRPFDRVTLDRLAPAEVARFVATRLAAAGRPPTLFEPDAVVALARHSAGLPRLVNVLGSAAVFLAGLDGAPRVGVRHVEDAAAMRDDGPDNRPAPPLNLFPQLPSARGSVLRRRAALGGMAAASGLLFGLPWLTGRRLGSPDAVRLAQVDGGVLPKEALPGDAPSGGATLPAVAEGAADGAGPGGAGTGSVEVGSIEVGSAGAAPLPAEPEPPVALAEAAPLPAPPRADFPAPTARRAAAGGPVLFRGPIFNETMKQGGHVTVAIRRQEPDGAVTARFDASQGLSGSGTLAGRVSGGGRIAVSGQLLMGQNPFMCDLNGVLDANTLTGSASFVRSGSGRVYRSRFNLVRV